MGYNIAVLGFGNLPNQSYNSINDVQLSVKKPQNVRNTEASNLNANSPFVPANLSLPLRLGRVSQIDSSKKCVKLALCNGASKEGVFVAQSKMHNLNHAINNFQSAENISDYKNVGYVNLLTGKSRSQMPEVSEKVKQWAIANGYNAVVWDDQMANINFSNNSVGREVEAMLAKDATLLANTQKYLKTVAGTRNNLQKRILETDSKAIYKKSLTADFEERARPENQCSKPKNLWYITAGNSWDWGPSAAKYSAPKIPEGVNTTEWKRDRIIEAALYWVNKGVPYSSATSSKFGLKLPNNVTPRFDLRGHFPARNCGLDCSNFVSWIYNFGLGKQIVSDVDMQIRGTAGAGRKVGENEALKKGDLLYYKGRVNHVVIYMDENHVIESTSNGGKARVADLRLAANAYLRPSSDRFLFARRPIE